MPTTRLAAILFADLAGFGELVARDEAAALRTLGRFRDLARPVIEEHGGELVDLTADEFLVLFDSATAAVQCALHLRLAAAVGDRPLPLRVGVHLGDVWREGTRAIGNGVNVAARVKQAASAGEILLSEDVWRQVGNKLDLEVREIHGRGLKNIERELVLYSLEDAAGPAPEGGVSRSPEAPAPQEPPESPTPPPRPEAGADQDPGARLGGAIERLVEAEVAKGLRGLSRLRDLEVKVESPPAGEGRGLTISIDDRGPPGGAGSPAVDPKEAALDRIVAAKAKAWGTVTRGLLAGGAFAWFAYSGGSLWLWAGALVFGALPVASGLRKVIEAGGRMRKIGKDSR